DRMARFTREAKVLASLNHPHIAQIYGIEERALVMELVPGGTLERPLPLETALRYAKQIAEALEAAHEKGIVHRDLKPANIMVTPEGVVKLLDFGLAAVALGALSPGSDPMGSPTRTGRATEAGMIIGTAAYMSPEQAVGSAVDRRSDIFSFGVVLFEMLTGKRAFSRSSAGETLAAVVKDTPDWSALPAETPIQLRKLLERTLQKDRRKRLQAIGEARIALESLTDPDPGGSGPEVSESAAVGQSNTGWWPWVAGALALALLAAGSLLYTATRPMPPRQLMRLNVEISPDAPLARVDLGYGISGGGNMIALSPDGERLALTLRGADGKVRLHTRLLSQSRVVPLAGTENAHGPFFSPKSDWIGFFAEGKLRKIAVDGGPVVALCDAPRGVGGSWGDDDNIVAALDHYGGLSRVPSTGGTPVPVTTLKAGEVTHRWPQVLPGSQAVLFTAATLLSPSYDDGNIESISLRTGERKTVPKGGFSARYAAEAPVPEGTGHIVYLRQSTLFAVPFDLGRLTVTGGATPILEDVISSSSAGGDFALAQNGTFVYLSGKPSQAGYSIFSVDSSGKTQALHAPPARYFGLRFSPDGKRLVFSINTDKGSDIWVKDLDRDTLSRLSFLPGINSNPVWTPDGKHIVFRSANPAATGIYGVRSDGSGEAKRLTSATPPEYPYSFSPDGKRLAMAQAGSGGDDNVYTMAVEPDPGPGAFGFRLGKAELFVGTQFVEMQPAFSPDGRWLAYGSNESGIMEVYVRPFPGPGGRWQASTGGGSRALWARDGRELLFLSRGGQVMAVSYSVNGATFAAGKQRLWTEARVRILAGPTYDIAPDGKRLAAILREVDLSEKLPASLTILLNFFDELRRKAPAGK
ncbi:MAG: protein kinase domain-containing protein, partial [Bryobacteraceae bacterium]